MEKKFGTCLRSIMIVAMILTGAFFVVSPSAVSAEQSGDYTYSIVNGSAVISAYTGIGGSITIPSSLGGYLVTGIGSFAFNNAGGSLVRSVTIPDGVTSIGTYAFNGCSSLTSIKFGSGLADIGNGAFDGCSSVVSITIPNSVTRIGSYAFYACTGLSTLSLGSGLVSIGDHAFDGCSALSSLTIPANVLSIGTSAFDGCSSLSSVVISNKVQTIGNFAFYGCSSLTTITIGSGVVNIGSSIFYGCDILTSITFLGLVAPANVASYWLPLNSFHIRGHAYAASNFPAPGNSFYGLMMGMTIDPAVPGAPTGMDASANDARVVLTWSAPSSSGGSSVSDYKIYRGTTSVGEVYLGHTSSGSTLTYSDIGLTNGVTYYYQVSAVNSYGEGAKGNEVSAKPTASLSAPRNLLATAGDSQVSLSWTAPSSIGINPIDYYVIYQDGVDVKHQTGTSTIITLLNNGQTYSYAVAAHDSLGFGPRSPAVTTTPVMPRTVPGIPIGLSVIPGDGQVALTWSAPYSNGGAAIDYYLVLVDGVARTDHYVTRSAIISGLTNGLQYSFTVTAHNAIGTSPPSSAAKSTPFAPVTIPGAPNNLIAMPGNGQVALTWSAPSTNGGAAIDYYMVYVDGIANSNYYITEAANFMGLVNGHEYIFTVVAHNVIGISPQSSAVKSTPMTAPGLPLNLMAVPGDGQVVLSWLAPTSNGGAAIDYYLVLVDGVAGTDHYTQKTATISGLTNDHQYGFTVTAHNLIGTGIPSVTVRSTPVAPVTVPGAPVNLTALPGNGQVMLSWSAPSSNGGALIDYYLVYIDGVVGTDHHATGSATITGLTNGRPYSFTIAAHNVMGVGLQSSTVKTTPLAPATVPGVPGNLTATPGNGQIMLTWSTPSSNGGAVVDYYLVYVDGIARADHYPTITATIAGLTNGRSYSFTIVAHNYVGIGAQSTAILSKPSVPISVPGVPIGPIAKPGDGQVSLTWSAPASNGGAAIEYYLIYVDGVVRTNHYTTYAASITSLTNGRSYSFTIAAHNSVGNGLPSAAIIAKPVAAMATSGLLESGTGEASTPQVAMNADRKGMTVWQQYDGAHYSIYARSYSSGIWGPINIIETGTGNADSPQVAMDNNGNAVTVWHQYDGAIYNIYANRFSAGIWGTAKLIETSTGNANTPQVAMDNNGNAIVVWEQAGSIYANRFSAGAWGTAKLLESSTGYAQTPQIAMDTSGNAFAVWAQLDNVYRLSIYASKYTNAVGWGTVKLLETTANDAINPQVAMNNNGNAIVAWEQAGSIYANRFSTGAWGTAKLLESSTGWATRPQVAMDNNGNAVVVWEQAGSIYANRFSTGAWGTAKLLESSTGWAMTPQIVMDNNGNALAIWSQAGSIYAARYAAGIWGTAYLLETGTKNAYIPQVAMDGRGNALGVWQQNDGAHMSMYYNFQGAKA